jgi:hypothetical protein
MIWQLNLVFLPVGNLAAPLVNGILIYSLLSTGLSLLLEKCLEPTMIFGRWYLFLVYLWRFRWHKKKDHWKRFFLKPLGLCVYCTSVWISIFTFCFVYAGPWVLLPFFCGLAYLWLRIIQKLI